MEVTADLSSTKKECVDCKKFMAYVGGLTCNTGRDDCFVNAFNNMNTALLRYHYVAFAVFGPMMQKIYFEHGAIPQCRKGDSRPAKRLKFHQQTKKTDGALVPTTDPSNVLKYLSLRGFGAATLSAMLQASCFGNVVGYPINMVYKARKAIEAGPSGAALTHHQGHDAHEQ